MGTHWTTWMTGRKRCLFFVNVLSESRIFNGNSWPVQKITIALYSVWFRMEVSPR